MENEASSTLDSCSDSFSNDGVLRKEMSKVRLKIESIFFSFFVFKHSENIFCKRLIPE